MPRRIVQERAAAAPATKLAYFGPKLPDLGENETLSAYFARYNLLGYDNGDGELACSMVRYESDKLIEIPLSFSETNNRYTHAPNILGFDRDGRARLLDERQLDSSGEIYHNFKRCPGVEAALPYIHPNGKKSEHTYADLMGHSFACALKHLFECNNKQIPMDKPTIIMVGRPASSCWAAQENEYAEILSQHLKMYFPQYYCNITILVLSESCAAMAGAVELNQQEWLSTISQIADLGSSTFDFITVTPNGIPQGGEGSYRFGGNDLDKNMAEYGDHFFRTEYEAKDGFTMQDDPGRVAKLRFKKEQRYGDNGANVEMRGINYIYYVMKGNHAYINKKGEEVIYSFLIDMNKMRCILENSENLESSSFMYEVVDREHVVWQQTTSWQANCRGIMQNFYENTKNLYDQNMPRRLILTGGVSNMPEVRAIAKEVFHIDGENAKLVIAQKPSQTVSRGLALILGNEVVKKFLLTELKQEITGNNSIIPTEDSLLDGLVHAACQADLNYYEKVIAQWAEGNGSRTLQSCFDLICDQNNGLFDPNEDFVKKACEEWVSKHDIAGKTQDRLNNKFRALFPEVHETLRFKVSKLNLTNMPPKKLDNLFVINNIFMVFDKNNCPENPYDYDVQYTSAQRSEMLAVFRKHREMLEHGGEELDYGNGYVVRIENYNQLGEGIRYERGLARVASIESIYRAQLDIVDDAKPIREEVMARLEPQINDFVESLTYYLNISAGR